MTDEIQTDAGLRSENKPLCIFVLQRGWVIVGRLGFGARPDELAIADAAVIRRWGTTAGLGELAAGGPTPDTVLDPCHGTVRVHELAVLFRIDCDPAQWPAL